MEQKIGDIINSTVQHANTNAGANINNTNNTNNWHSINIILTFINIVCLVITTCALCISAPRANQLNFDYLGAIIGILSLLVAIFVASQIYQTFTLRQDIYNQKRDLLNEAGEKYAQIDKEYVCLKSESISLNNTYRNLTKELEKMKSDLTFISVFNFAQRMYDKNNIQYAIDGYMDALNVATTDNLGKDTIEAAVNSVYKIINEHYGDIPILPNKKTIYCNIIGKVQPQSEECIGIYNKISLNSTEKEAALNEPQIHSSYYK